MQVQSLEQVVKNVLKRDFEYEPKADGSGALDVAAEILRKHGLVVYNHQGNFTIATIVVNRQGRAARVFPGCTRKAHDDKDNRTLAHMTALARAVRLAVKILVHDIQMGKETAAVSEAPNNTLDTKQLLEYLMFGGGTNSIP